MPLAEGGGQGRLRCRAHAGARAGEGRRRGYEGKQRRRPGDGEVPHRRGRPRLVRPSLQVRGDGGVRDVPDADGRQAVVRHTREEGAARGSIPGGEPDGTAASVRVGVRTREGLSRGGIRRERRHRHARGGGGGGARGRGAKRRGSAGRDDDREGGSCGPVGRPERRGRAGVRRRVQPADVQARPAERVRQVLRRDARAFRDDEGRVLGAEHAAPDAPAAEFVFGRAQREGLASTRRRGAQGARQEPGRGGGGYPGADPRGAVGRDAGRAAGRWKHEREARG
mmetsp:Transcript_6519/g.26521  ORF Transcript_6519/g.26521 Transcript_6519/m.26521 type:complete len:282 (+) Transcript_6519:841-1686(+)